MRSYVCEAPTVPLSQPNLLGVPLEIRDPYNQMVHFTTRRCTLQLSYFTTKKEHCAIRKQMPRECPRSLQGVPKGCPGNAQGVSRECPRGVQGVPKGCPRGAQGVPKGCPRGAQGLHNTAQGLHNTAQGLHNTAQGLHNTGLYSTA